MDNSELIWRTKDGRSLKIKEMTSDHLTNTLNYIDKRYNEYVQNFGTKKVELYKKAMNQEIRLRKLNRINLDINDDNLF
jgi:hypothetical protein